MRPRRNRRQRGIKRHSSPQRRLLRDEQISQQDEKGAFRRRALNVDPIDPLTGVFDDLRFKTAGIFSGRRGDGDTSCLILKYIEWRRDTYSVRKIIKPLGENGQKLGPGIPGKHGRTRCNTHGAVQKPSLNRSIGIATHGH